jgi:hypothetical protein
MAGKARGEVELATWRSIGRIKKEALKLSPEFDALAAQATALARTLDQWIDDPDHEHMAFAATARELRATITQLAKDVEHDDRPDPFTDLVNRLSEPL